MHSADNLVMCLRDINGHADRHIDGFDGIHGAYVVGQRNLERRMLQSFFSGEGIMSIKYMD